MWRTVQKTVTRSDGLKCEICGKKYQDTARLHRHYNAVHFKGDSSPQSKQVHGWSKATHRKPAKRQTITPLRSHRPSSSDPRKFPFVPVAFWEMVAIILLEKEGISAALFCPGNMTRWKRAAMSSDGNTLAWTGGSASTGVCLRSKKSFVLHGTHFYELRWLSFIDTWYSAPDRLRLGTNFSNNCKFYIFTVRFSLVLASCMSLRLWKLSSRRRTWNERFWISTLEVK